MVRALDGYGAEGPRDGVALLVVCARLVILAEPSVPAAVIDTLSPLTPKAKPPLPVMAVPSTCSMALRMV
ncbi:hypothetical protein OG223_48200 [Streptomyces sp. NBC_01478]|uniref:hypothetical protein n=1 Tax=Streptomyces sp. NBC_01478 TaxID=2903882 RepID=UPI002E33C699|nr:hypothetical protein [Streptomyces sp. NBC_01478]